MSSYFGLISPRFAVYGSTNIYSPLKSSKNNGRSGEYITQAGGWPKAMVAKLATTVSVKMIEIQRWACRMDLLKVMEMYPNLG